MMRTAILNVLFLLSWPALATVTTSTVQKVQVSETGMLLYVWPSSGINSPLACDGTNGNYYTLLFTRETASDLLNILLAAQARGASVTFIGEGDCIDNVVSETLNAVSINN